MPTRPIHVRRANAGVEVRWVDFMATMPHDAVRRSGEVIEDSRVIDDNKPGQTLTDQIKPSVLESRDHLTSILQSVEDGVFVQDQAGVIVYANQPAANLLNAGTPLDLHGTSIDDLFQRFDLLDPAGAQLTIADLPVRAIFTGAPSARRTIIRRNRDSSDERWWIFSASPVRDDDGQVRHVVCIIRDATDRVQGVRANARLAAIVASSSDAIVGKTLDAIITNWNPAAERLYGYAAEEAVGQSISILVPPERLDELSSIMARLRAGEHLNTFESVRIRKDGTKLDVSLTISPIRDQDGRIIGASTIARNVTEQRRAQDALRLLAEAGDVLGASLDYETTLANVAQLIVPRLADWCSVNVVDESGTPTPLALTHSDPEKAKWGISLQKQIAQGNDESSDMMRVVQTGEALIYNEITDDLLVAAAKSPEHLEAMRSIGMRSGMVLPMMTRGRVVGTLTLVYAESGRVYRDDEIELAKEICRRAAIAVDNARLYAEAQRAAQAREDFLLTASHELRTPLTIVKATTQMVSRYLNQSEPDRSRIFSMITRLQGEIGRLEALTSDLLDAARIQRGRFELHPEPCDLVDLIQDVVTTLDITGFRQPDHRIVIDAGRPVSGFWDSTRLRQVIDNLVSNALKFSPNGGEICIRVRSDDDTVILEVEDEGIGIDPVEAAALFQPFERGASVRHSIGGVGLGLYITRQIVDAHGGTISLDSKPGSGSRFTISLPTTFPATDHAPAH